MLTAPVRLVARRVLGATGLNHLVRMVPVADLVHELGGGTVLDAGSGSQGISRLLDRSWTVTAVDSSFDDYGATTRPAALVRGVVGDVRDLPFDSGTFDVVLAVDLLEHIAPEDRARAIGELGRVARRRVIVACPAGEEALTSDRRLAQDLDDPPGWLAEHLANGFPSVSEIEAALAPLGAVRVSGNEHVVNHIRLVKAELSMFAFLPTRLVALAIQAAFRRGGRLRQGARATLRRVRGADAAPTYRTIVWVDVGSCSASAGR